MLGKQFGVEIETLNHMKIPLCLLCDGIHLQFESDSPDEVFRYSSDDEPVSLEACVSVCF